MEEKRDVEYSEGLTIKDVDSGLADELESNPSFESHARI